MSEDEPTRRIEVGATRLREELERFRDGLVRMRTNLMPRFDQIENTLISMRKDINYNTAVLQEMATNTVRHTLTLTKPQVEVIDAEAERLGITKGEMIRRILDEWRERIAAERRNNAT